MDAEAGRRGKKGGEGNKMAGRENNKTLEERLKALLERAARIKGTPEEATKKPQMEEREKRLRAKIAEEAAKKA